MNQASLIGTRSNDTTIRNLGAEISKRIIDNQPHQFNFHGIGPTITLLHDIEY
jgi:hypothetical protein